MKKFQDYETLKELQADLKAQGMKNLESPRNFTVANSSYIQDENFDFDAGISISGDFGSDDVRLAYAEMICKALNDYFSSPHPTMPQPETNCPKIDGSKLSAHDQVTRDEFDQEDM